MLGSAFAKRLGADATLASRADLDVCDAARIFQLVAVIKPDVVINCAGDVDAERAESNPDPPYKANVLLPSLLATACSRSSVRFVHFSSTGCYGDWKKGPFTEEDNLAPPTIHHQSKAAGERAVRDAGCDHLILRTGWLFGGGPNHKKNFVWRRLVEANRHHVLASDTAQWGNPTLVDDVVEQTLLLIGIGLSGTYNCVSPQPTTRFAYVSAIVSTAGLACRVEPSGAFRRLAPVSSNETATNYRLNLLGLDRMPDWTESLAVTSPRYVNGPNGVPFLQVRL